MRGIRTIFSFCLILRRFEKRNSGFYAKFAAKFVKKAHERGPAAFLEKSFVI